MSDPACMTSVELALWDAANAALASAGKASDSPCRDCTAAWAAAARSVGRCNGQPGRIGRAPSSLGEDLLFRAYGMGPLPVAVEP